MRRRWHVVIMAKPRGRWRARMMFTSRRILRQMLRHGYIVEFRAYRSMIRAGTTVLVYNCQWADWVYRKTHGM